MKNPLPEQGQKFDSGKPKLGFLLRSFPNALRATAGQNQYGAEKYSPFGWKNVDVSRYEDALARHFLCYLENPESVDEESGINHIAACIWNAMAIFELNHETKQ